MATPFATASDLAIRLKRDVWTGAELTQVEQFLADASEDLRFEIGWQVFPPAEVTITAEPDASGHIYLPGSPIVAITSVTADGDPLAADRYLLHNKALHVYASGLLDVTYSVGYAVPPEILVKWTCVLAAQTLVRAADEQLGGGTPSSESLAEYRISFSERQQMGELPIPQRVLERLRSTYGQAVYTT